MRQDVTYVSASVNKSPCSMTGPANFIGRLNWTSWLPSWTNESILNTRVGFSVEFLESDFPLTLLHCPLEGFKNAHEL